MECFFTEQAEKNLESIADYIALDSPSRALKFIRKLRERCQTICIAPEAYSLCPEYGEEIRKVPFGNYLILYRIEADFIAVIHVAHSARFLQEV